MLEQLAVRTATGSVTPAERAFYRESGWVKPEGLPAPELAAQMLGAVRG